MAEPSAVPLAKPLATSAFAVDRQVCRERAKSLHCLLLLGANSLASVKQTRGEDFDFMNPIVWIISISLGSAVVLLCWLRWRSKKKRNMRDKELNRQYHERRVQRIVSDVEPYVSPPQIADDDPPRSQMLDALAFSILDQSRVQSQPAPEPAPSFTPEPEPSYSSPMQLESPDPSPSVDSSPSYDSSPDSSPSSGFDSPSIDTSSIC